MLLSSAEPAYFNDYGTYFSHTIENSNANRLFSLFWPFEAFSNDFSKIDVHLLH